MAIKSLFSRTKPAVVQTKPTIDEAYANMMLALSSKSTYLKWVEEWKKEVKALEEEIRTAKRNARGGSAIRETQEYNLYVFNRKAKGINDLNAIWDGWYNSNYFSALEKKPVARDLYAMRRAMKVLSVAARIRSR